MQGDRRSLARTLTALENRTITLDEIKTITGEHQSSSEHWQSLAITGAPGVGKSCLLDGLLTQWAGTGLRVALLAVDPSSPRSGGALLGDRVRMTVVDHPTLKNNIYLRSIATRKASGSVPLIVADMTEFLLILGWDRVVIETVGAGQAEVRCAAIADRILVVEGQHVATASKPKKQACSNSLTLSLSTNATCLVQIVTLMNSENLMSWEQGRHPRSC